MGERGGPGGVDRWLRRGLEPPPAAPRRVTLAALRPAPRPARGRRAARRGALAAALAVAAVGGVWWLRGSGERPPAAGSPIHIANYGRAVTVVAPGGDVKLYGPGWPPNGAAPRLVIEVKGE